QSGGGPNDADSGGALQLLLPFGLTVNRLTGYNANFGSPNTGNSVFAAFKCEFVSEVEAILSEIGNIATGGGLSAFQRLLQCGFLTPIPVAGDACDVVYPTIN